MGSPGNDQVAAGTVVVGLDWSGGARSAVEYALREGARRGVGVDVVTVYEPLEAWSWAFVGVDTTDFAADDASAARAAHEMVNEVRTSVQDELGTSLPSTTIHVRHGRPAEVLVDAARDAEVLVVGHRGRGAVASTVLGSVGLYAVQHASCPVTVVRPRADGRG